MESSAGPAVESEPTADVLAPPDDFPFPFEPYGVQKDFMRQLWQTVDAGHLGVFESPTGTGKSMSMICGALAWLRANEARQPPVAKVRGAGSAVVSALDASIRAMGGSPSAAAAAAAAAEMEIEARNDEPAWVTEHVVKASAEAVERAKLEKVEQQEKFARIRRVDRARGESKRAAKRLKVDSGAAGAAAESGVGGEDDGDDGEFMVTDYISEDEDTASSSDDEDEEETDHVTKILFCSRTHSQLTQFMREIRSSPFGEDARAVVLGSRQTLCINEKVTRLSSQAQMNDKCKDLQQKKAAAADDERKSAGCPFLDAKKVKSFGERALARVQDVEELLGLGNRTGACPYYGTRSAIAEAEIVAMPYNLLLHKSTREAVGIKIEGNIILIDEAHNLLPSIEAIHSNAVSGSLLQRAHAQLLEYHSRYVMQIMAVLKAFLEYAKKFAGKRGSTVIKVNAFLQGCMIDNVNLFKLARYFEKSEISKKVNGFVLKQEETRPTVASRGRGGAADYVSKHVSALKMTESFFHSLTNADKDGRLVIQSGPSLAAVSIKFLLLNPAVYFDEVLSKARAVILAGGTMSPMNQFSDELCGVNKIKIDTFSCGHVIPPSSLAAAILCKGPSGQPLEFTYENRSNPVVAERLLQDAGQLVLNLSKVVPDGLVVFFPSYDYEEKAHEYWQRKGVLGKIEARKRVFREARSGGEPVDNILAAYSKHIEAKSGGAVLLSVVGGKMSEGINFKDDLGRCVVVIGLPFPNVNSPELKEKMAFLDKQVGGESGKQRGQEFYTNICMKAVNQSIGRAIRHQNDYSTIVLADARYARGSIQQKLSHWIHASINTYDSCGKVIKTWSQFFKDKATAKP